MKKLLAIVLLVLMVVSVFAGCGGGNQTSGSGSSGSAAEGDVTWQDFEKGAFAGKTIYLWTGATRTAANEEYYKTFEDATGAKVECTVVPYGDGLAPYSTAIASGGNIDYFAPDNRQFPTWIIKNLIDPVSSVIDLKTDEVVLASPAKPWEAVANFWTFNGEVYAFNNSTTMSTSYLAYRKSAFEEAGLDDPYELWQAGEWNFDKMKDLLADLTYDSDEDGIVDKFGLTGYADTYWMGCAGGDANYVRWDEEGKPQFAIDDPDIIECYEFYRELQVNNYYQVITSPVADFVNGDAAMYIGIIGWDASFLIEEIGVEDLGYVPMPASPSNTSGISNSMIHSAAYAIPSSVKEKELLKEWIQYAHFSGTQEEYEESLQEIIDKSFGGSKEWFEFDQGLLANAYISNGASFGLVESMCNESIFWKKEESVVNCVTSIAPACQAEIDSVFYDMAE